MLGRDDRPIGARRLWILTLPALACAGEAGDGPLDCEGLTGRNADEVVFCNGLDEPVLARVELPEGTPPSGGWPGVIVLHGSSGLFRGEGGECSEELLGRFSWWSELLNQQGYAVILPSSFYSRGFCDSHATADVPRGYDDRERIVTRAYDAAAAAAWLCAHPQVDCSRLAVLGFSHGASVAMLIMHEDLAVAEDPRLRELVTVPLRGGVAYYPGCGLDGQLANRLGDDQIDRYFYPQAPMWIPHAEDDDLVERCELLRDPQVDVIAGLRGDEQDRFELEVYPDADHGFDVWYDGDSQANLTARADAELQTLEKLAAWFE